MSQNFIGSNNINLLFPSGQFGSRIKGGQDASSPRYIFTRLEKITRILFPEQDDNILKYLNDDGTPVEPQFYVPIIPMVLVNGSKGIGTGFSTEIMCYNPLQIITYIKNKLQNIVNSANEFLPYYEGFTGSITRLNDNKFLFKGTYEKVEQDKIKVTELPIGYWTEDFKELLNDLQNDKDKEGKKIVPFVKDVY
jgi:DNA topoisomerase-2